MKDDVIIQHLIVASNHATVLCFTNVGKVYRLRVFEVPQASRGAKGRPIINLLPLDANETVTAILPLKDFPENHYVFMATASGTVKRVELVQFSNVRSNGLRAIELNEEDTLIGVAITDGNQQIMLFSNEGKAIRFAETDVRAMGRTAKGVRGMRVKLASSTIDVEDADVENDDSDDFELVCSAINQIAPANHVMYAENGVKGLTDDNNVAGFTKLTRQLRDNEID